MHPHHPRHLDPMDLDRHGRDPHPTIPHAPLHRHQIPYIPIRGQKFKHQIVQRMRSKKEETEREGKRVNEP